MSDTSIWELEEGRASSKTQSQSAAEHRCAWRPGSYCFVVVTTGVVAALLAPKDTPGWDEAWDAEGLEHVDPRCPLQHHLVFYILVAASLGAGAAVAYLSKRALNSRHALSAMRYALVNWIQSLLATLSCFHRDTHRGSGRLYCRHGVLPLATMAEHAFSLVNMVWLWRLFLYLFAFLILHRLIAERLDALERSSGGRYCGRPFHWLLRAQEFGVLCCTPVLASLSFFALDPGAGDGAMPCFWMLLSCMIFVWICNMLANLVAMDGMFRSCMILRHFLKPEKLTDASQAVRLSLNQALRHSAQQGLGICFRVILTLLAFAVTFYEASQHTKRFRLTSMPATLELVVCISVLVLNSLGNAAICVVLSGSHRVAHWKRAASAAQPRRSHRACVWECLRCDCLDICWTLREHKHKRARCDSVKRPRDSWAPAWQEKVRELCFRGVTMNSLLEFYTKDLSNLPDWSYSPSDHRTRDVVRRAVIPMTAEEGCAYATSRHNRDGPKRAEIMVTHNWGNRFRDLLGAILADALQECSSRLIGELLDQEPDLLRSMLTESGHMQNVYWICAFAVNQHASICHTNPCDKDPLTDELHPVCTCSHANIWDPDGRSAESEINKFDDMMGLLATTGRCKQLIAVDRSMDLFRRAWCVAEIAEAKRLEIRQSLKLVTRKSLADQAYSLRNLDIRDMRAGCDKDKELILGKIEDIDAFNSQLRSLIFDPHSGLLASWEQMDSLQQMGEVGRLIRWSLADAGTGKVWRLWDAD